MMKHSLGTAFPATSEWQRADRASVLSSRASVHRCLRRVKVTFLLQPSACPPQAPALVKWACCAFLGEIPSLACSRAELEHESPPFLHSSTSYGRVITIIHGVLPQRAHLVLRYLLHTGSLFFVRAKSADFQHTPPHLAPSPWPDLNTSINPGTWERLPCNFSFYFISPLWLKDSQ